MTVCMPALRMRYRDSSHLGKLSIVAPPQPQMPVIRHQTIRRNPYIGSLDGCAENFLKGTIVCGFFEQWQPTDPSV
jgi:hypothetical protein